MSSQDAQKETKKALIASANPLFGRGLEKLLRGRANGKSLEIRLVGNMKETFDALDTWQPDLVIVDYDDRSINRNQFLSRFMSENRPMQVILVSLQASGEIVVYDRRTLSSAQMEDWFDFFSNSTATSEVQLIPMRKANMKHFTIVSVLVIVMTAVVYLLLTTTGILPIAASLQAQPIDRMFNLEFFFMAFFFSLITVIMVYSIFVFRNRKGDSENGAFIKSNSKLEIFWTVIPLGIVLSLSYLGSIALADTRRPDPQAMIVKVTAGQWFWTYDYPDYGIQTNKLYLPVNKQVLFRMTSKDVIHSFWVPQWRIKQAVLPGDNLVKELRMTPDKEGKFTVMCAEMCGGSHAYMTSDVLVVSQADFTKWVDDQTKAANADPVTLGKQVATTNGCIGCHSIDGKKGVGPTWKSLAGSPVKLADGSTVTADDAYIKSAILDPNAQIVDSFPPNLMPSTYKSSLTDPQVNALIAYIKSLK
jgi:cytochrome c oxidase subunit II